MSCASPVPSHWTNNSRVATPLRAARRSTGGYTPPASPGFEIPGFRNSDGFRTPCASPFAWGPGFSAWGPADFPALSGRQDRLCPLRTAQAVGAMSPYAQILAPDLGPMCPPASPYVQIRAPDLCPAVLPPASPSLTASPSPTLSPCPSPAFPLHDGHQPWQRDGFLDVFEVMQRESDPLKRYHVKSIEDRLIATAMQCQVSSTTVLMNSFAADFGALVQCMQDMTGTDSDLSGYAALSIALRCFPVQPSRTTPVVTPLMANARRRSSFGSFDRSMSPSMPKSYRHMHSSAGQRNGTTSQPFSMPAHPRRSWSSGSLTAQCATPKQKRPRRRAVDPKTGDQYVIRAGAPVALEWDMQASAHTGSENLRPAKSKSSEDGMATVSELRCDRRSVGSSASTGRGGRTSIASTAPDLDESASAAVLDGFTVAPFCGGSWDWPLARQEKKERLLWLNQLELLSELDELRDGGGTKADQLITTTV